MKLVAATVGALVLSLALEAQEGRFRTSVDTVSIYATVSDADGRLEPNLVKDDFTVLDDGQPREITLFSSDTQPITVVDHARHEREHVSPVPAAEDVDALVRRRASAARPGADRQLWR